MGKWISERLSNLTDVKQTGYGEGNFQILVSSFSPKPALLWFRNIPWGLEALKASSAGISFGFLGYIPYQWSVKCKETSIPLSPHQIKSSVVK